MLQDLLETSCELPIEVFHKFSQTTSAPQAALTIALSAAAALKNKPICLARNLKLAAEVAVD